MSLLGSKPLESVSNPRLFRLKQRTGLWKFDIIHLPSKSNSFADAASRRPVSDDESALIASASAAVAISASDIAMAGATEPEYSHMISALQRGACDNPSSCGPYWQVRDRMFERDGLLLYDDRLVIPRALRERVLDVLHAAHQSVSCHGTSRLYLSLLARYQRRHRQSPRHVPHLRETQPLSPASSVPAIGPADHAV